MSKQIAYLRTKVMSRPSVRFIGHLFWANDGLYDGGDGY